MPVMKKKVLFNVLFIPFLLTIVNGHKLIHAFEDEHDGEEDHVCLICEMQADQQDEHYLVPSSLTVVDIREPITTEVLEPITLFLQTNSVHFKLTTRPPPIV